MSARSKSLHRRRNGKVLVAVWVPTELDQQMEAVVAAQGDTDKSKLIRKAIRTHIAAN